MAVVTFTIDTAGFVYTDRNGLKHVINTNADFALNFTDTGVGGIYYGDGSNTSLNCTDGFRLNIEADPNFTSLEVNADGAVGRAGAITFLEDGNVRHHWSVSSINFANADGTGSNNLASVTLTSRLLPMETMTLTNVNMA